MSSSTEDTLGCLVAAGAVAFGIWWVSTKYEIRSKVPEAPILQPNEPPAYAGPQRWTGLVKFATDTEDTTWSLDADTVKGPRTKRLAWIVKDHKNDPTQKARLTKVLYQVDCDTGSSRMLSIVEYDAKNEVLNSYAPEGDPQSSYAPPGSMGDLSIQAACDKGFEAPPK